MPKHATLEMTTLPAPMQHIVLLSHYYIMISVTESCENLCVRLNSIYLHAGMNNTLHGRAQYIQYWIFRQVWILIFLYKI